MATRACLAVTGTPKSGTACPNEVFSTNPSARDRQYNLADIIDRHLGTAKSLTRKIQSRVQGGPAEELLNLGHKAWHKSVIKSPESWTVIKVYRVVPITQILSNQLQEGVRRLFTNALIYRSPSVGAPHGFSFEGAIDGIREVESITIWFADLRVRDISLRYIGGATAGPYFFGIKHPQTPSDTLTLAPGEYITDIFVWHHMGGWTAGIQFVKSSLERSPIYGIKDRESNDTQPPILLSGNGNTLLGISGAYTSDHIC
ncbi:hypothetical protein B0J17DRAFT_678473 [Rhizoctonia solani]|nr:hypothetical protein B0J17DRAFT_678473 [Rhizoctonia solani]